jgi:type IV pilus assembly protein PilQ
MFNGNKKRLQKIILAWIVFAAISSATVLAQEQAASGEDNSSSEISISADGKIQAVSFKKDADIRDVLRFLGAKFNKNIVPSPKVEGVITVTNLYNVTFQQAMDAILGGTYVWVQKGDIIEVFTKEDKSRMTFKSFTLSYITADEARKLVQTVLSPDGKVGMTTPAEVGISTGDSITQAGGGATIAASDTIVIYDYPERIAQAAELIKEVDIKPLQVLIETSILAVQLTENMEFGIDWNLLNGTPLEGSASVDVTSGVSSDQFTTATTKPIQQIAAGVPGAPVEQAGFATTGMNGLRIGISSGDVSAFITALETVTDVTVLATPKILAVNKQLGQVYIGNKIGYISQTTQTQTSTTQQVTFLDTGTKLSFRPYIGENGNIRMDIHPKDSSGTLKENNIPDESSTELATNVVVKDGQTIVIGGLFRDVTTTVREQVPILGDIPFIGAAFRRTNDLVQRQEVIVLLTPHIINEPEDTNAKARVEDIRLKKEGARKELQWIDRARLSEDAYSNALESYLKSNKEEALVHVNKALELRPGYLEALRLKDRLTKETDPDEAEMIDMRQKFEQKETFRWLRK